MPSERTHDDNDPTEPDSWGVQVGHSQVPGQLIEFEDDEPPPETPADRVQVMLATAANDERAVVKLYAKTGPGKIAWCGDYKPAQFEEGGFEMIRNEYGPGEYEIRLYGPGPSNRQVVRAKTDITILPRASDATKPAPQVGMHGLDGILRVMQEQNRAIMDALTNRPQADPRAEMTQTLAMLAQMKEVFGGSGGGGTSIRDQVETMRMMRELAKEMSPENDKEKEDTSDPLMSMLPSVLGLIQQASANQQAQPAPAHFPPVQLTHQPNPAPVPAQQPAPQSPLGGVPPAGVPVDPLPDLSQSEDPMQLFQIMKMKTLLATLVAMAVKNAPHEPAADLLANELPEELWPVLEADDWFAQLTRAAGMLGVDVAPHQAWITAVRELLMEEEPEAPEVNEQPRQQS